MTEFKMKKCQKCDHPTAVLRNELKTFEQWMNTKEIFIVCAGYDKKTLGVGQKRMAENGIYRQRFKDCNATYRLKIKVEGIEPF